MNKTKKQKKIGGAPQGHRCCTPGATALVVPPLVRSHALHIVVVPVVVVLILLVVVFLVVVLVLLVVVLSSLSLSCSQLCSSSLCLSFSRLFSSCSRLSSLSSFLSLLCSSCSRSSIVFAIVIVMVVFVIGVVAHRGRVVCKGVVVVVVAVRRLVMACLFVGLNQPQIT